MNKIDKWLINYYNNNPHPHITKHQQQLSHSHSRSQENQGELREALLDAVFSVGREDEDEMKSHYSSDDRGEPSKHLEKEKEETSWSSGNHNNRNNHNLDDYMNQIAHHCTFTKKASRKNQYLFQTIVPDSTYLPTTTTTTTTQESPIATTTTTKATTTMLQDWRKYCICFEVLEMENKSHFMDQVWDAVTQLCHVLAAICLY